MLITRFGPAFLLMVGAIYQMVNANSLITDVNTVNPAAFAILTAGMMFAGSVYLIIRATRPEDVEASEQMEFAALQTQDDLSFAQQAAHAMEVSDCYEHWQKIVDRLRNIASYEVDVEMLPEHKREGARLARKILREAEEDGDAGYYLPRCQSIHQTI